MWSAPHKICIIYREKANVYLRLENLDMAQSEISFSWFNLLFLLLINVSVSGVFSLSLGESDQYISAVGDSGMRRDGLRVAIEAWNQCNEVGEETPQMGSPRAADCFDVQNKASYQQQSELNFLFFFPVLLI